VTFRTGHMGSTFPCNCMGKVAMPWKESSVMYERLRFVARLLEGEQMSHLCREFGISRKTGCKIFERYKDHGLEALSDRSRRPVRYANQLPARIESPIVGLKGDKPHGAPARSASFWSGGWMAMCAFRPRTRSMPCATGTASSSRAAGAPVAPRPGGPDSAGVLSDNA
jgi:leucine-zipper of insertion element IS481